MSVLLADVPSACPFPDGSALDTRRRVISRTNAARAFPTKEMHSPRDGETYFCFVGIPFPRPRHSFYRHEHSGCLFGLAKHLWLFIFLPRQSAQSQPYDPMNSNAGDIAQRSGSLGQIHPEFDPNFLTTRFLPKDFHLHCTPTHSAHPLSYHPQRHKY